MLLEILQKCEKPQFQFLPVQLKLSNNITWFGLWPSFNSSRFN